MKALERFLTDNNKPLFVILFLMSLMPFVSPAVALFMGLAFALLAGRPYPKFSKQVSKYLLQFSVVGQGFGMNLH